MAFPFPKNHAGWLLTVSLLAAGCEARGLPSQQQPPRAGELRVILPGEPSSLSPAKAHNEAAVLLAPNLFSQLVAFDADGRLFPDLAQRWSVGEGGLSYTFHLRRDVRWHDGRPFTAADVRWNFERWIKNPGFAAEAIRRIERIETPDDATVTIRLREPWAPFLVTLAWYGGYLLPRHLPLEQAEERPVGTGPFQFGEWERGQRIVFVANPRFHRTGPHLERLVFTFEPDPRKVPQALLTGKADYTIVRPPLDMVASLENDPAIRFLSAPSDARTYCAFNLRRRPLQDRRVREAINRAIDRQQILEQAFHGFGAPALGFYTPTVSWAYNGNAHVPEHDPQRARELLAEAGFAGGLELELLATRLASQPDVVQLLTEQLAAVGITLRPVFLSLEELLQRSLIEHDFDITLIGGSQGPDPENLNSRFGSKGPVQFMGYSNPELDAALAEGARTLDVSRRAEAYFRAQEILAHDLPIAPLVEGIHLLFLSRRVHGLPQVEARGLVPVNEYSLVRVEPEATP